MRREGHAYVDKIRELGHLLDSGKFLFLARPCRFGKTLMLSTIECMSQGHLVPVRGPDGQPVRPTPKVPDERLFSGMAWEDEFADAPRQPVIRLDMSHVTGHDARQMEQSLKLYISRQALLWYGRGCDPGVEMQSLSERQELAGRLDLATVCGGRVCVIELKYNRSLRAAQEQADRKQYGRSLLAKLDNKADATCIALHVSKSRDGKMHIEGAQRPVQDVQAQWTPLHSGPY